MVSQSRWSPLSGSLPDDKETDFPSEYFSKRTHLKVLLNYIFDRFKA